MVIVYNWIPTYTASQISPHSWITEYMQDLALPVNFVGTSTDDRRHILPQKEVGQLVLCLAANRLAVCLCADAVQQNAVSAVTASVAPYQHRGPGEDF